MADTNRTQHTKEKDAITGVETTGHEWDGLKELNNPLPRWWVWVFLITIIWSFGYWVVYPAWPTITGHTEGSGGWTQYRKLKAEQSEILERRGAFVERIKSASLRDIMNDQELYAFAVAGGKTLFKENCAACHGSGGQGGKGYPNLNDDDWLWGGDVEAIYTTLQYGIRSAHDETRTSAMPAFGKDGLLKPTEIAAVADHVLSLSTGKGGSEEGAKIFGEQCASCHGDDGHGNREFGAPNLADAISLYGGSREQVIRQINNPRMGVMPNWGERLSDDTLKQLAIYVHSLGGGEALPEDATTSKPGQTE